MAGNAINYLDMYLGPLAAHMSRPDVTDIYINRPGELWVETLGGQAERHEAPEVDDALLWRLARQVANVTHQAISREHPLLAATLPDGTRAQFVAPPATRGSMAVALRRHVSQSLSLDDYAARSAFQLTTRGTYSSPEEQLPALYRSSDMAGFLRAAVKARKTIIVSGGTSTGKTTFLNALLREVEPLERLIVIEDTPELRIEQENSAGLIAVRGALGETSVGSEALLAASLRMRPDRIILGELRGPEAFTFLRAVNTGHAGSMTTIHADNVSGAFEQLFLLVLTAGMGLKRDEIQAYARSVVDIVVQLRRGSEGRFVSEVEWRQAE